MKAGEHLQKRLCGLTTVRVRVEGSLEDLDELGDGDLPSSGVWVLGRGGRSGHSRRERTAERRSLEADA